MRNKAESRIQHDIVMYLQSEGIFFWSTPNEAAGGDDGAAIRMGQLISIGLRPGMPDLNLLVPTAFGNRRNRIVFLEVKAPNGIVSERQKNVHSILNQLGTPVYVVRSVKDVELVLDKEMERGLLVNARRILGKFLTFFGSAA